LPSNFITIIYGLESNNREVKRSANATFADFSVPLSRNGGAVAYSIIAGEFLLTSG